MKKLKGIFILTYLLITIAVLMAQPVMHKPAVIEGYGFKIKDEFLHPKTKKISDYEVKVKFYRAKPIAQKPKSKEVTLTYDDSKPLSLDTQYNENTHETTITLDSNSSSTSREMQINIDGSAISNKDMTLDSENMNYSDKLFNMDELEIDSKLFEIGEKIKNSREERIAWNKWRSDLQNEIMYRSAIEGPIGTLITFNFMVTEQGRIYNVNFSCNNPKFEEEARSDLARVLREIERSDILKFPKNTKRKQVKFQGGFMLDYDTQYSSPSDYSDYERVRI